jgi:hypothetical protein
LSYGQWHVVLLAIRLGAADFLAGLGVRLPLLLDDPFVHLDAGRARELWDVLARIAAERQVFVATQDRLLVDHLGIEPHLDLDASPLGSGESGVSDQRDPALRPVADSPSSVAGSPGSENGSRTGRGPGPSERAEDTSKTGDASMPNPDLWSFLSEDG